MYERLENAAGARPNNPWHLRAVALWSTSMALALTGAVAGCNSTPEPNNPAGTSTAALQSQGPAPDSTPAASSPAGAAAVGSAQVDTGCSVGGCSGELCLTAGATGAPGFSTCQYQREWDCYKSAHCARAADGTCAWEKTAELEKCLAVY